MKPEVIILGGGPTGLAAALALGGRGLPRPVNVLLLDTRDPRQIPDDTRGTALTQATQAMFQALGVWQHLDCKCTALKDIIVTDGTGAHDSRTQLLSFKSTSARPAAAAMVENRDLTAALLQEAERSPTICMEGSFSFDRFEVSAGGIHVFSTTGVTQHAGLLLAADGRHSAVRQAANISSVTHDYQQTALSFAIEHELSHEQLAEEHFSPDGVFAMLPLAGHSSSIVWGTSHDEAARLMALEDADFNDALQQRMGQRLGLVRVRGRKGSFPLVKQIANSFIAPRLALLGDAAHAIHPLAGLGLNLGFKDVASLADCLVQAAARGEDPGGQSVLERYDTARRFDTMTTSIAMDALNGLFVNDNPILTSLRDAGLRLVDHLPRAKSFFMAQASGLSQNNPRLMQGLLPG